MEILYLCADPGIPIRGHKGAAIHVREMAGALTRAGHGVTLLSPRPGPADGPGPLARLVEAPAVNVDGLDTETAARTHVEALLEAASAMHAQQPFDFIYERYSLWSDAGARLSAAVGVPLALEVNAPLRLEAERHRGQPDGPLSAQIERAQFGAAAALSVVSEELRDYVGAHGAAAQRVRVVPNGVDPRRFHPAVRGGQTRARLGLEDKYVLGFVGRPRPWHDLDTLLDSFSLLRREDARFHLLLVGDMPATLPARLDSLGLGDAVTLTGPVAHDSVPRFIAAMDAAIAPHPALEDFYFSPLKLFEYMACGVPVVAAAIGQPGRMIRHAETGYLYAPGSAPALASCVRALRANPAHARAVAWNGAAWVLERHTWDANARAVMSWFAPPGADGSGPAGSGLPILDRKLRQRLYRATRPDLAAPLMARRMRSANKGRTAIVSIEVLKYKPGRRCVLAYDLARHQRVVGKVYRDDRGWRLFQLQQRLVEAGFRHDAPDDIRVPAPLAFVPEMRMFVQSSVPGQTYAELAAAERRPLPHLAQRAGEGLAKLHATPPPHGLVSAYTLADEMAATAGFAAEMAARLPAQAARVGQLCASLQAWAAALPPGAPEALLHRDFYYSQVLFDGPRLALIDFDLAAIGDPALDAANFAAHLRYLGLEQLGSFEALGGDVCAFVESYTAGRQVDAGFHGRLAFYEATTLFRLLRITATRDGLAGLFEPLCSALTGALALPEAKP